MGKTEEILINVVFNLLFVLFILAYVVFFRQSIIKKKEYENKLLLQQVEHKKELLDTQIEIQNQTMQHIGREIHDNIGQKLTLASLYTQKVIFESKDFPNFNQQSVLKVLDVVNESLSTLRDLSKSLTDNTIEKLSIIELINQEVQKVKQLQQFEINFQYNENIHLTYTQKVVFLRITQEFIQNSIKHSNCKIIFIHLEENLEKINFILKDDGDGFNTNEITNNGIGLINMKKRTELLGGKFELESNENGTKIIINLSK
jgi:signal transduction histidine kinase